MFAFAILYSCLVLESKWLYSEGDLLKMWTQMSRSSCNFVFRCFLNFIPFFYLISAAICLKILSIIFFERDAFAVICLAKKLIWSLIIFLLFYFETNDFSMGPSSSWNKCRSLLRSSSSLSWSSFFAFSEICLKETSFG